MAPNFTVAFKLQAVEKALGRSVGTSIKAVANSLGIGHSTLQKWIVKSAKQEFETLDGMSLSAPRVEEKKPHDWRQEERFSMVMRCSSLDAASISALCREQGLYPHHVEQWKLDFMSKKIVPVKSPSELKALRAENKALKKELRRKEKALAETAALLVLQKKVNDIWGTDDEDFSQ